MLAELDPVNLFRIFLQCVFFGILSGAIFYMRKRHAHKVYVIWLVISFFFTAFLGPAIYAYKKDLGLEEICGAYEQRCTQLITSLTTINDELVLLAVFIGITVVPQLLAYFFSALSGSATAPRYIWTIQQAAVWSLIKFIAGVGGIFYAQGVAELLVDGAITNRLLTGSFAMAEAFVLAFFHLAFWDKWEILSTRYLSGDGAKRFPISKIRAIHQWSMRNVPQEPPHTLTRTALIKLLESDAVYDFVTQSRTNT
jgi:hypothetical protein